MESGNTNLGSLVTSCSYNSFIKNFFEKRLSLNVLTKITKLVLFFKFYPLFGAVFHLLLLL